MIGHPKRLVELELVAHLVGHVDDVSVCERQKKWLARRLLDHLVSHEALRESKKERERRYVILRSRRTCRLVVVICEPRKRPDGEGRIWDG